MEKLYKFLLWAMIVVGLVRVTIGLFTGDYSEMFSQLLIISLSWQVLEWRFKKQGK